MATAAAVYAKAMFELGQETKQLDALLKEIKEFSDTMAANKELYLVLSGAGFNPISKRAILKEVRETMKLSPVASRFLDVLVTRGRISDLSSILQELERLIEKSQGVQSGQVRTTIELSAEELAFLGSALSKRVGGKVKLSQVVDPSLLGGVVATVAGKTFDASLRSQLERFKSEMI